MIGKATHSRRVADDRVKPGQRDMTKLAYDGKTVNVENCRPESPFVGTYLPPWNVDQTEARWDIPDIGTPKRINAKVFPGTNF